MNAREREVPPTAPADYAVREMLVSIDLLERGYDVFRSAVPGDGPVDLIAARDGRLWRVHVAEGDARPLVPPPRDLGIEVVASIAEDGAITYAPMLP